MTRDPRRSEDPDAGRSQPDGSSTFEDSAGREDRRPSPEPPGAVAGDQEAASRPSSHEKPSPGAPGDPGPVVQDDPPAFGVMLHLLGAVALALASLVWGGLLLFGAVASTGPKTLAVFAGLTLAVAWFAWLVRATMGREFRDDETWHDGDEQPRGGTDERE